MILAANNNICGHFSHVAKNYDQRTDFHRNIAELLTDKISDVKVPEKILDIGMGTGYLTRRLKEVFPGSNVSGIDFAKGMIEYARMHSQGIEIIEADANKLPFDESTFDLIVSNLAYQWVENLRDAFSQSCTCLKSGGRFCFSMFGKNTFRELFASLDDSVKIRGGMSVFPIQKLVCSEDVSSVLNSAGFDKQKVEVREFKVNFKDLFDIIRWIKEIGANSLKREIFVGRKLLAHANEFYLNNFKEDQGVFATLEVIWGEASK